MNTQIDPLYDTSVIYEAVVANGKYAVQLCLDGRLRALRYGEPWRDLTGDGMVLALVQEIVSLKERNSELQQALQPDTQ